MNAEVIDLATISPLTGFGIRATSTSGDVRFWCEFQGTWEDNIGFATATTQAKAQTYLDREAADGFPGL